jgi:hypothetical protein
VKIALHCGVSRKFTAKIRAIVRPAQDRHVRTVARGGTSYAMDTSGMGRRDQDEAPSEDIAELLEAEPEAAGAAAQSSTHQARGRRVPQVSQGRARGRRWWLMSFEMTLGWTLRSLAILV